MQLTLLDISRLLKFLVEARSRKSGLPRLVKQIKDDLAAGRVKLDKEINRRALERILEASDLNHKVSGKEPEYSAQSLFDAMERNYKPTVRRLHSYVQQIGFEPISDKEDGFERIQGFLSTNNNAFNNNHLDALVGDYHMYRRCWFKDDGKTYMQSFVKIRADDRTRVYRFTEIQRFREFGRFERSTGYLFPSGQSILAICNAADKSTVKFLSINGLLPKQTRLGEPVEQFSGNGIASSDIPPHSGYGFHCVRVADADDPLKDKDVSCRIMSFDELKSEKVDVFSKVIYYDRFQYVDFVPKEGDS